MGLDNYDHGHRDGPHAGDLMSFVIADIQNALANSMFGGDSSIAGMAIFAVVMATIFVAFKRNVLVPFAIMIPIVVVFSTMGIVPSSMAIILTLISVLVIAAKAREAL